MWQQEFGMLAEGYSDILFSKLKKNIIYSGISLLLLTTLKSDTVNNNTIKKQDIPISQYRYHEWFILSPIYHDE